MLYEKSFPGSVSWGKLWDNITGVNDSVYQPLCFLSDYLVEIACLLKIVL